MKVPADSMTPYNAQATLFFQSGFWSLYLPISVAGRVSDIWRSYFAQALFKRIGVDLGFLPRPIVVQDRNPHSYEADFDAEIPLYTKSSALISYLLDNYVSGKNSISQSFIETLESLWIDMYERSYIEKDDVQNMQLWISALMKIGYPFPSLKSPSFSSKSFEGTIKIVDYNIKEILEEREKINKIGTPIRNANTNNESAKDRTYCDKNQNSVVFGSSDLHDGPRTDISSTLANLNQTFIHIGPRKLTKFYPKVPMLAQVKVFRDTSLPLQKYNDHSTKMLLSWPYLNTKFYVQRNMHQDVDAFICTFPAAMCQLWIPMNKTIIFLPAHRYNLGRCSVEEWNQLNKDIKMLKKESDDGVKPNTIGAVSRYDMEYLKYYTGIQPTLVPSFSGYYIDSDLYKGDKEELLIFCYDSKEFIDQVTQSLLPEFSAKQVYHLYKQYTIEKLGRHRAVITLPYSVMSYRTSELYALGIPIFAPSIKFYMNYYNPKLNFTGLGWDRTSTSHPYCSSDPKLEQKMRPELQSLKSIHPYSPNIDLTEDAESENYWLQFSDFYDWPHIQLFDDYAHLKKLLFHTNFKAVHEAMKKELSIRKTDVINRWCDIVQNIDKHKQAP